MKKRMLLMGAGCFLSIILTILLLSFSLYNNFEKVTLNMLNTLTNELLTHVEQTTKYTQEMITLSGTQAFYSAPVTKLREKKLPTNFEVIEGIRFLDLVSGINPHIHSIYIYNKHLQYIYSNSDIFSTSTSTFGDQEALNLIKINKQTSALTLHPRCLNLPNTNSSHNVYSFVMYDTPLSQKDFNSAIVINVYADSISNLFEKLASDGSLFIMDRFGTAISDNSTYPFMSKLSKEPHITHILKSQDKQGYFIDTVNQKKKVIMHAYSPVTDFYYVRQIPYALVMKNIILMKTHSLYQIITLLAIGGFASIFMLFKLYIPFNKIIYSLELAMPTTKPSDVNALIGIIKNLSQSSSANEQHTALLKSEFLKGLLHNDFKNPSSILQSFLDYNIAFSIKEDFYMITLEDDNLNLYANFLEKLPYVSNFEILKDDKYITIILQKILPTQISELCTSLSSINGTCIAYSSAISSVEELYLSYRRLLEVVHYQIFFPKHTILSLDLLHSKNKNFIYPLSLEQDIISFIKKGQLESTYSTYLQFVDDVLQFRFNSIKFSIKRLYITINSLHHELDPNKETSHLNDVEFIEQMFQTIASFEDINQIFYKLFEHIILLFEEQKVNKNTCLIDKIKEIIHKNLFDTSLSMQSIGDMLNMSPAYLGRIFKSVEGQSVSEYVNTQRITQAKELLLNTSLSVKDIGTHVGFINDTYLYTLFKNHTGYTPSEFRKLYKD